MGRPAAATVQTLPSLNGQDKGQRKDTEHKQSNKCDGELVKSEDKEKGKGKGEEDTAREKGKGQGADKQ